MIGQGYAPDELKQAGLINPQGRDTFYQRIVFPCFDHNRVSNLYGRQHQSSGSAPLLGPPEGRPVCVEHPSLAPSVIVVEGLFDLASLWQEGYANTTCGFGTHLAKSQLSQLSDLSGP